VILVLDNYDSFTFNLVQLLGGLGATVRVVRNDELAVPEIRALEVDGVVISPGPGLPADAGISVDLVRQVGPRTPLLGVCLGHQAVCEAFGGRTVPAARVMHGKTAPVRHLGQGLFRDVPSPVMVARYHSLVTDPEVLPGELEPIAWTDDDREPPEIQAVRHRVHPIWGVQFHPESHFSDAGPVLLRNFLAVADAGR
jgi:anthranilate synthase component 2